MPDLVTSCLTIKHVFFLRGTHSPQEDTKGTGEPGRKGYVPSEEVQPSSLRKYKTMVMQGETGETFLRSILRQCSRIPLLVAIEGRSSRAANSFILHSTKTKLLKNRIPSAGAIQ